MAIKRLGYAGKLINQLETNLNDREKFYDSLHELYKYYLQCEVDMHDDERCSGWSDTDEIYDSILHHIIEPASLFLQYSNKEYCYIPIQKNKSPYSIGQIKTIIDKLNNKYKDVKLFYTKDKLPNGYNTSYDSCIIINYNNLEDAYEYRDEILKNLKEKLKDKKYVGY